jgi:hypothetical protein
MVHRGEEAAQRFGQAALEGEKKGDPEVAAWARYAWVELLIEKRAFGEAASVFQGLSASLDKSEDEELILRGRLVQSVLEKEGVLTSSSDSFEGLLSLAGEAESKGMMEIAAEAYTFIQDHRAREIYLSIASRLPEEYRIAYLNDPFRRRVFN